MRETQRRIIEELEVAPSIDAADELERRVNFLVEYARETPGVRGYVLGISGGQDSTLAGRLAQLAVERLRAEGRECEFTALRLPYGRQHDEDDATLALQFIRPDHVFTVDIAAATDALVAALTSASGQPVSDFNKGNVKARMRMVTQYAVAGDRALLVIGTDHAAESVTGYFTKFGDGAADILPLSGLTKSQGAALLQHMKAPSRLYTKTPTADLLDDEPGQTDEASLGMTYREIDAYLSGETLSQEVALAIESRYGGTEHKRRPPVAVSDTWWQKGANS